jgi:uncharacterized protein with gpF-like domain
MNNKLEVTFESQSAQSGGYGQRIIGGIKNSAPAPEMNNYALKTMQVSVNNVAQKVYDDIMNGTAKTAAQLKSKATYQELGATSFRWGRSSSKEKRELHKEYYDKIFTFDDPPIIYEKLGIKGLPRQIWNCKCHMLMVAPTLEQIINKHTEVRNAKRNIFTKIKYTIKNSTQCNNQAGRYRRFREGQAF